MIKAHLIFWNIPTKMLLTSEQNSRCYKVTFQLWIFYIPKKLSN